MNTLSIKQPKNIVRWVQIFRLYRSAFPASERKPFSVIVNMYRKGKTDLWCVEKDGCFVGLAATINGGDAVLLDYFAVDGKHRGEGIGSAALAEIRKAYRGKGVFLEIESVYEQVPQQSERLRRKRFYLSNGMEPMNVMVELFGVKMELLGYDCRLSYEDYQSFYRDNYNEWAARHICKACHPEEEGGA